MERKRYLEKIEKLRSELKELNKKKDDVTDEEMINKSRELDKLLNEYYRFFEIDIKNE